MSLAQPEQTFAGHEMGDCAALQADGEWYRCYTFLNRASWRIEAVVTLENPGGGESVLFHSVLDESTATELVAAAGLTLDCPKVLAVGTTFVVHYLKATDTVTPGGGLDPYRDWGLYRTIMDMTAFDASVTGWSNQGAVGLLEYYAAYDACPIEGSATDFVVSRITDENEITVERFNGFAWIDTDWTSLINWSVVEGRVVACWANDTDNSVLVTYEALTGERAGAGIWTTHLDADDGSNQLHVETFPTTTVGGQASRFMQVGHCRVGTDRVAVVAEFLCDNNLVLSGPYEWMHHIAFRRVAASTAARVGNEHWCPHLQMCSRPWAYQNGQNGTVYDCYVLASYKSLYETNDWEQAYMFALNLDLQLWDSTGDDGLFQTRPILTVAGLVGVPDARVSKFHPEQGVATTTSSSPGTGPMKRINHVSSVSGANPTGPDVKTRTIAIGVFSRLVAVGVSEDDGTATAYEVEEKQPENAGIRGLKVYLEDPWAVYRDPALSTQPIDNFKAPYPRTQCQTIDAGRTLFISGGTPGLYDGQQPVECGFPWKPEIVDITGTNLGSGELVPLSTYTYIAAWEWIDASGQIHRSGPTRPVSFTTDSNDTTARVYFRTLSTSLKDNTLHYPLAQKIALILYRLSDKVDDPTPEDPNAAAAPDGLFHRVFGGTLRGERPVDGPVNDLTLDLTGFGVYFYVADGVPDSRLVYHATAPGAFQFNASLSGFVGPLAQTPPAFSAVASWQNRVWGADALNPAVIWYSDEILPDADAASLAAPVFTGNQTFRCGEIGDIVAMHALNNYLIVFTASAIYAIGAVDADGGQMSVNIEPLHEGIGCIEPRSIVLSPPGIFFQSAKGIHLLNRDRMLEFDVVGAAVSDEIAAAGNIRSASIDESDSKLKFVCNGRPVTTYTTTWTITIDGVNGSPGVWSIDFGVGDPVTTTSIVGTAASTIANALEAAIAARIGDGASVDHDLRELIASVSSPGATVVVEWQPDVVPSYSDSTTAVAPADIVGVDTSALTTKPQVLVFNYFTRTWSRHDLQPTSLTARYAEAVDGCMWRGTAEANQHVVLTQNAILVQRSPRDADQFLDQNYLGDSVPVPIDVRTTWLHFANVANWQRIRTIDIQGETPQDSSLFVDVETDVSGDHAHPELDTYTWSTAPSSGRIKPRIQLCSSVRVRIYETEDDASLSENIAITALVFELGIHKGPRRQGDGQTGT